jgi:hypothetical protein
MKRIEEAKEMFQQLTKKRKIEELETFKQLNSLESSKQLDEGMQFILSTDAIRIPKRAFKLSNNT